MADVRGDVALLFRRAGFGAAPADLDAAARAGYAATVERLLDMSGVDRADAVTLPVLGVPPVVEPQDPAARQAAQQQRNVEASALRLWWLDRMVTTSVPLREKLTLLWHGHFATALSKVQYPSLMYRQNQIFRRLGAGSFPALTEAVAKDPAMLIWLDSNTNVKAHPNENFSRELMELFTLGIGQYAEADVKEAARAFTGWTYDRASDAFTVRSVQHDTGVKLLLDQKGAFTGEEVIRLTSASPNSARFVAARLWSRLAYPVGVDSPIVKSLAKRFADDFDVSKLVRAILLHRKFRSVETRVGLVKQPIEFVVGTLRSLGLRANDPKLLSQLAALGQEPFEPPSVGGWPQNSYWLSAATALARLEFAASVANRADISVLQQASPQRRVDTAARMLGIQAWSNRSRGALAKLVNDPRSLLALAITTPEHTMN